MRFPGQMEGQFGRPMMMPNNMNSPVPRKVMPDGTPEEKLLWQLYVSIPYLYMVLCMIML